MLGSLEVIGKPAGLYRNIGEGVKEFFYEVIDILMCGGMVGKGRGTMWLCWCVVCVRGGKVRCEYECFLCVLYPKCRSCNYLTS